MKRRKIMIMTVVAVTMVIGYNVYSSQKSTNLSDLAMINMEALAENETAFNNCSLSDSEECCFCYGIHYTYQSSASVSCETKRGCKHWTKSIN